MSLDPFETHLELIVVKVRLFASLDTPTHYVVVGESLGRAMAIGVCHERIIRKLDDEQ